MSIPDLNIPEIQIQPIFDLTKPVDIIPLTINVPGCTYQHRDIKNTGNRNLLLDDPNGVFTVCDAPFPSFNPMDYQPNNLIMSEDTPITSSPPEIPEPKPPVTIITFCGICALAPLYVGLSVLSTKVHQKS